jgi:hypothetical protein
MRYGRGASMIDRHTRALSWLAWLGVGAAALALLSPTVAHAHHEALFGPQSSLAVESQAFASLQMHTRVFGSGALLERETTHILSAGVTPFDFPLGLTVVVPFTYDVARSPAGRQTGPFSSCEGCWARENVLLAVSYRFVFDGLNASTGKDGNFALVSASLEPPTGDKDYAPFKGPFNGIAAGMVGFEWSRYALIGLGYYRVNMTDDVGSKKGNNVLAALGFGYTPIDEPSRLLSVQLGLAAEVHDRDVLAGADVSASGGWEILASPTIVWGPSEHLRFFTYVSLPITEDYRSPAQEDRWRAGLGAIYSFERDHAHPAATAATSARW